MISLIDYDVGNINSLANLLKDLNIEFCITRDKNKIKNSTRIILPGVSNFSHSMNNIIKLGLDKVLEVEIIDKKKPVLGICSGMQILCTSSEEGHANGLNFVNGKIKKFPEDLILRVPHIGWNKIQANNNSLFKNIDSEERFYFCHSYFFEPDTKNYKIVTSKTKYGNFFCSSFSCKNIFGVQFHPEKSQDVGKKLIQNFLNSF